MADDLRDRCADLAAEHAALDAVVADLDDAAWDTPTASDRWAVRDQIGHLAYFDEAATQAIVDPEGFAADLQTALAGDLTVETPGLVPALQVMARDQIAIDQPSYKPEGTPPPG